MKQIFLIALIFSLTACGTLVKRVDYEPQRIVPESASPAPIKFSGIELLLPPGMDVGTQSGGSFCAFPHHAANRSLLRSAIDHKYLKQDFHDALEASGYDVVDSLEIAFDIEDEIDRAEYSIKAKIRDVHIDMCVADKTRYWLWNNPNPGEHGEMYVAVDWTVWDALRRTTVFKHRTEGYTHRKIPNVEGLTVMFHDAFVMAAHNLAADEDFYRLIVDGTKPPRSKSVHKPDGRDRPRLFDPREEVTIPAQPLSSQPFTRDIERKRQVAVKIEKFGHGSGFFITRQGHILTNAHVVGDAQRTRVVTADKQHAMTAEILRIDKPRDVALLKVEDMPDELKREIVTLPLRLDWPPVGADVYAIGAPHDRRKLADTVTKGIVSAHRESFKIEGLRQNFIQADVKVHPGNSGGPLIDENGNIVGLSATDYHESPSNFGVGLSFFIPITEALEVLDINYSQTR